MKTAISIFGTCPYIFLFSNVVCETRSNRSAELLAKYCDSILKKSSKTTDDDMEKERIMSEIVSFKFLISFSEIWNFS